MSKKFWFELFCLKKIIGHRKIFGHRREGGRKILGSRFFLPVFQFPSPREAYIPNFNPLVCLEPLKKLAVGGGWVVVVVKRHFRVSLWAKAFGFGLGPS